MCGTGGNFPFKCGIFIAATDFVVFFTVMVLSIIAAAHEPKNEFCRFASGSDKPAVAGGFENAIVLFICSAALVELSQLLGIGCLRRSSALVMLAMVTKCLLVISLIFICATSGYIWMVEIIVWQSVGICFLYSLWWMFVREQKNKINDV